jgi:hypothetical protein
MVLKTKKGIYKGIWIVRLTKRLSKYQNNDLTRYFKLNKLLSSISLKDFSILFTFYHLKDILVSFSGRIIKQNFCIDAETPSTISLSST